MLVFFTNISLVEFLVRYLALFLLLSIIDGLKLFWITGLHKNIQLMLEFLKVPFLVLHFSYNTLMTFLMMLSAILLSMLMILLSILSVIRHLIRGINLNRLLNLNLIYERLWAGSRSALLISMLVKLKWFCLVGLITGSIDVKIGKLFLEEKPSFKMLRLTFSSKLDWGSYIISIAKTASKKIGALIRFMKFLSPGVALYFYKSTIRPCMEYCCHVWVGVRSCYLELLDKLQKRICRTVGSSLAVCLEPLAHRRDVASLSLFYRYYFGKCSSELAQLVLLAFSRGRSTRYSDRLHDFSVTVPRFYKGVCVNSFFPRTASLWNSLPIE